MYYKDRQKDDLKENFSNSMYKAKEQITTKNYVTFVAVGGIIGLFIGFVISTIIGKNPIIFSIGGGILGIIIFIILSTFLLSK